MADTHGHHHHAHDVGNISGRKIFWVTVLNAAITAAEVVGGLISGSLALLSDSIHNLSDTIAVALSYFANKIARKPKTRQKTFGYKRAEIIAAFINSSVLLALSIMLLIEAYKRFRNPEPIDGTLMISVALIGLAANLFSVLLLKKDSKASMNIKASYLHLLSDTISSVGVVLGGIAIQIWSVTWIDPLITLFISLYIIRETWLIIKKTVDILMQSSPEIDLTGIKKSVEKIEHVRNIHHIHTWMIDEKTSMFEAHVEIEDMMLSDVEKIYPKIEEVLKEQFDIDHITLQAEVDQCCDKGIIKQ